MDIWLGMMTFWWFGPLFQSHRRISDPLEGIDFVIPNLVDCVSIWSVRIMIRAGKKCTCRGFKGMGMGCWGRLFFCGNISSFLLYAHDLFLCSFLCRYLFWTDSSKTGYRIERSSLTGRNRTVILVSSITRIYAVTADVKNKRIYFTKLDYIESLDYNGQDRDHVFNIWNRGEFYDVALFQVNAHTLCVRMCMCVSLWLPLAI